MNIGVKLLSQGNYSIKLRKKINTNKIETYWDGNKEYKLSNSIISYFGIGDINVSHNDKLLAYSLDLKGSEYYTIYIRRISDKKIIFSNKRYIWKYYF